MMNKQVIHDIVSRDFNKNHQNREYDLKHAHKIVDKFMEIGGDVEMFDNVIVFKSEPTQGVIEFHCMNGGHKGDLINAVNSLNMSLVGKYDKSVTYYDNPKINSLLSESVVPVKFEKIDGGIDKTYTAMFDLRGK